MLHNRRHILGIAALAFSAATLMSPHTASAQLGRLKKAAADAAKEAAGVKPKNESGTENFPITVERLDAVLATLEPAMLEAQRVMALKAATAVYDNTRKANEKCVNDATLALTAGGKAMVPSPAKMQQVAANGQVTVKMMQRLQPAIQAKRYREAAALQDSLALAGASTASMMFDLEPKCGKLPYKPAVMLDDEAINMARQGSGSTTNLVVVPPANRAGMTMQQFGMVRERAALWALQQTGNAPVGNNKYSVFTTAEQSVLEARGDRLKKMAPFLKDQPARWTSWGELQTW